MPISLSSLRDDDEREVAGGEPGELCVKGPQVMQGYWQKPDETEKVFTKDGWLKTGDVAVLEASGYLKIVDRKKDMILVSGFNVYPNEIEGVVAQHPGVLEVRSEEHTSELQSLMRISYAVFCLKKKIYNNKSNTSI